MSLEFQVQASDAALSMTLDLLCFARLLRVSMKCLVKGLMASSHLHAEIWSMWAVARKKQILIT